MCSGPVYDIISLPTINRADSAPPPLPITPTVHLVVHWTCSLKVVGSTLPVISDYFVIETNVSSGEVARYMYL